MTMTYLFSLCIACKVWAMAQEDMERESLNLRSYLAVAEAISVHNLDDQPWKWNPEKDSVHRQVVAFTELCQLFLVVNTEEGRYRPFHVTPMLKSFNGKFQDPIILQPMR